MRHGNYTEADDPTRHSVVHSIFVGVTIEGGYNGPGLYKRTDTPLPTDSAVEGSGTTSPVYNVLYRTEQGAIDLTVMLDGSGSLKVERWDSDEVRQTAVESQVSIRHRALELQRPIRLRLSLAAC